MLQTITYIGAFFCQEIERWIKTDEGISLYWQSFSLIVPKLSFMRMSYL